MREIFCFLISILQSSIKTVTASWVEQINELNFNSTKFD